MRNIKAQKKVNVLCFSDGKEVRYGLRNYSSSKN